jgi:uncharacterized protein (TIGR02001 family)
LWIAICITLSPFSLFDLCHAAELDSNQVSLSGKVSLASRYLFQGIDYSNGNPVVQPELSVGYRGFSVTSWANLDLDARHINELDWSLAYAWERDALSLTPGYIYYQYPNRDWDSSQEVYLDLSYATFLDLFLSTHYDFDAGDGAYWTLGFSHSVEDPQGTLQLGSNLFYQRQYYDETGIPSLEFVVKHRSLIHGYLVTPSVSYFATWNNGDFQGPSAVPSRWFVSLTVGGTD